MLLLVSHFLCIFFSFDFRILCFYFILFFTWIRNTKRTYLYSFLLWISCLSPLVYNTNIYIYIYSLAPHMRASRAVILFYCLRAPSNLRNLIRNDTHDDDTRHGRRGFLNSGNGSDLLQPFLLVLLFYMCFIFSYSKPYRVGCMRADLVSRRDLYIIPQTTNPIYYVSTIPNNIIIRAVSFTVCAH